MQVKIKLFGQLAAVLGAEVLLDISVSADSEIAVIPPVSGG